MMLTLTIQQIEQALPKVQPGLTKYCWLQEHLDKFDVAVSREFQKRYNGFYRVRRSVLWQAPYFALLESAKRAPITFEAALSQLFDATGQVEASFASKLVATLDPSLPVIDKFVLAQAGLTLPRAKAADRQATIVDVYAQLTTKLHHFAQSPTGKTLLTRFQAVYPQSKLSTIKMIDLVLWQMR